MSDPREETEARFFDASLKDHVARRMPVLVVIHGKEIGRRYLLNERSFVIGRDPQYAQLTIPDPTISARHAVVQVEHEASNCELIDLGSRNGTYVNGTKVDQVTLCDGDKVFLGETILKFTYHDALEESFHTRLDEMMNIDDLTGLYLKRPFDLEYAKEFELAGNSEKPLSVMMMDMDGLKTINEERGHQMGSFCVASVGKIIGEVIQARGIASRFGGDEFIAFLREMELHQAVDVGEMIRGRVEAFRFERDGICVRPTISIGVTERREGVRSAEELVRLADEALYRAKRRGRNVVSS